MDIKLNDLQKNIDKAGQGAGQGIGAYAGNNGANAYGAKLQGYGPSGNAIYGGATAVKAAGKSMAAEFVPEKPGKAKFADNTYKPADAIDEIKNKASGIDVKNQTDYMTLMASTVSDKDMKSLMDGDYKSGDMKPDEIVTIVDRIKTTMAKAGVIVEGYNSDLDADMLKEITGSPALAESFSKYDVPVTKENIEEAKEAIAEAESLEKPSEDAIAYMVDNDLGPTIGNYYKAIHSGTLAARGSSNQYTGKEAGNISHFSNEEYTQLKKQIEEVIESSGYEVNEETEKDAFSMIERGLLFTEENFEAYEKIKSVAFPLDMNVAADMIARGIKEGLGAKGADLSTDKTLLNQAEELVNKVNQISDEAVDAVIQKGKTVNIRNLSYETRQIILNSNPNNIEETLKEQNLTTSKISEQVAQTQPGAVYGNNQSAYSLLQEARLSMTVSSTYFLLKNGINVEVTDLSLLVDQLKEAENLQFEAVFGKDKSEELVGIYSDTQNKIEEIKTLPLATIGLVSARSSYSLNVVYSEGINLKNEYEKAGQKYEPLMTEVRKDLGDSINKAFAGVYDILAELDREANEDNERAVRILGYNNMAITDENIDKVKDAYSHVKNTIDMMTPGKVLDLIRSGQNPLELSMEELEEKLADVSLDLGEEAERYSHFLYRMEQAGDITDEEKESFIGIYRLINQTLKDDGAAVGTLINSQGEINFKNLLSAVRTRKNKGYDLKIDDSFGYMDKLIHKSSTIDQQIASAYSQRTKANAAGQLSPEAEAPESYNYRKMLQAAGVPEEVVTLLENTGIEPTVDNLVSTDALLKNSENIFQTIMELSDKSTKKAQNVDKNVDNNRGIGGEIISNTVEFETEIDSLIAEVTDKFESKEEVSQSFAKMSEATEKMLSELRERADNSIDVRSIAASYKQVNVVRALANNDFYQVPIKVGQEYTSVSVRLIRGQEDDKGQVSIYMDHAEYGEITARFSASQDKGLEGIIVCGDDDGLAKLKGKSEAFDQKMDFIEGNKNIIFAKSAVSLKHFLTNTDKEYRNISNGLEGNDGKDAISTRKLYRVAKEFIKTFIAA